MAYLAKLGVKKYAFTRGREYARPTRPQIIVEQKVQFAVRRKLSSNLTAERTYLGATL